MLDLQQQIIGFNGVIAFNDYFLWFQESDSGVDYTILDSDLNEVDGGELCSSDLITLKELFKFIDVPGIDENGIWITNADLKEFIINSNL